MILWIQEHARGVLDGPALFVTHLGDHGQFFILLGVVLLFFRRTRLAGCTVLLALLLDYLMINVTLKELVARPRPFVVNEAIRPLVADVSAYRSFPSGHAGASFAAMFAVYRWAPKKAGIFGLVLAVLVALSRLYVGVHYPTDILAGMAVGFMCSVWAYHIVTLLMRRMERNDGENGKREAGAFDH